MRVLATYVLWFLSPLLVAETVAFGGGLHGAVACAVQRDPAATPASVATFVERSIGLHAAAEKC